LIFVVDNQLPPALARFIQSEFGMSAVHVADIGLRDASDAEVWKYASETGSVLISKDEDSSACSCRRQPQSWFGYASATAGSSSYWIYAGEYGRGSSNGSKAAIASSKFAEASFLSRSS
jgi:hypothetical protein